MSEEPTERLNDRNSFEWRVLTELADLKAVLTVKVDALGGRITTLETKVDALDGRLAILEERVDARLRETRPIWESVLSKLDVMNSKLDVLGLDVLENRAQTDLLKKRLPPAA
ncbi:MAG: hypothetical protein M3430_01340 [Acidobacteriota bacterium]|nr:hypothetical protein [Acidobacteriota bacterium]